MATGTIDHRSSSMATWLVAGFICGALAVLIFHQGAAALMHAMGVIPNPPYSTAGTKPWGVPQIWSIAFWGGVWGVLLAAAVRRQTSATLLVTALVFGAVLPTLVAWFIVAPLKGQPMAAGFVPGRMMIGPIINGAWGLGTGILLLLTRAVFRPRA
jgi:hypothetical protein